MNVLFVTSSDPRITTAGYSQRTNLLWEALKEHSRVYTIVYDETHVGLPMLIKGDNPIFIFNPELKKHASKARCFFHRLSGYLTGIIYSSTPFPSDYRIEDIYNDIDFDIVVSRYIHIPARYHFWNVAPLIVDVDDHPLQVFETIRKYHVPLILRPFARFLLRKQLGVLMEKVEIGWVSNQFHVDTLSSKFIYLPNVPYHLNECYRPNYAGRKYLFTIGLMDYEPNYKGVDTFLSTIWPLFHEKYPNIEYLIGGKNAPVEYVQKWQQNDGVKYVGYVEDLSTAYECCLAAVVPIYSGSGTCIKVLEAMSYSRVCISTPFGARGFTKDHLSGDNGLMIFNDASEFIKAFESIANVDRRTYLESKARLFIDNNYSYSTFKSIVFNAICSYNSANK